jgi:hypothetical protein
VPEVFEQGKAAKTFSFAAFFNAVSISGALVFEQGGKE